MNSTRKKNKRPAYEFQVQVTDEELTEELIEDTRMQLFWMQLQALGCSR